MDEKSEYTLKTATLTQSYNPYIKRIAQFLVPVFLLSFLISYFSGFPIFYLKSIQFSNLISPDKKYMFLICNGILAFLAKSVRFSDNGGLVKSSEEDMQLITEQSQVQEVPAVQKYVVFTEYASAKTQISLQREQNENEGEEITFYFDRAVIEKDDELKDITVVECVTLMEGVSDAKKNEIGGLLLENAVSGDEYEGDELSDATSAEEEGDLPMDDVNGDALVSTEELNKKFEDFIRKMKAEIRIEAQKHLKTV